MPGWGAGGERDLPGLAYRALWQGSQGQAGAWRLTLPVCSWWAGVGWWPERLWCRSLGFAIKVTVRAPKSFPLDSHSLLESQEDDISQGQCVGSFRRALWVHPAPLYFPEALYKCWNGLVLQL